jgi:superfamily II DNA or RNA helicase
MLTLRPYQQQIIEDVRQHFRRRRKRVLIRLGTGGGKTAIASRMLHGSADKGKRVWFCCHRRELVAQVSRAFTLDGLEHSIVDADHKMNPQAQAQICSIPTLMRRIDKLPEPDVVVWDECHHLPSKSWGTLAKKLTNAYHVGLSATPVRLDGRGLAEYFDEMVRGPSEAELIDEGFLSKYRLVVPPIRADLSGLHRRMGDIVQSEAAARMNKPAIIGDVVSHYRKFCDGAKAIGFCASIEHSKDSCELFNAAGIPSLHIDGTTDPILRDKMMEDYKAGRVRVLFNVELFGEGFDCQDAVAALLMRPTDSFGLHRQQVGRVMRAFPGKEFAWIIDTVGNTGSRSGNVWMPKHGLPDDDYEWTLAGDTMKKSKNNDMPPPRICPYCFGASRSGSTKCTICGEPFPVEGRQIKQVEGELEEMEVARAKREMWAARANCNTLEELIADSTMRYGPIKGPRHANYVWQGRLKKKAKLQAGAT